MNSNLFRERKVTGVHETLLFHILVLDLELKRLVCWSGSIVCCKLFLNYLWKKRRRLSNINKSGARTLEKVNTTRSFGYRFGESKNLVDDVLVESRHKLSASVSPTKNRLLINTGILTAFFPHVTLWCHYSLRFLMIGAYFQGCI